MIRPLSSSVFSSVLPLGRNKLVDIDVGLDTEIRIFDGDHAPSVRRKRFCLDRRLRRRRGLVTYRLPREHFALALPEGSRYAFEGSGLGVGLEIE